MRRERAAAMAFAVIVGYGIVALPVTLFVAVFLAGRWSA
jgi:hypothetical protein